MDERARGGFRRHDPAVGTERCAPTATVAALGATTRAIQDSIRTGSDVRTSEAEAKRRVAISADEADATRSLLLSPDPGLLIGSGVGGMRFNLPIQPAGRWVPRQVA
jgi:hypothetical protein